MTIISHCTSDVLKNAARALREGRLVVFPTETVYGLGADASNENAVRRIYEVKGRPLDHPVIVHVGELSEIEYWISDIPDYALTLARKFWPGPMTLILPRSKQAKDFITGGQESVGLRIPSHPLALELLREFHKQGGRGVAAPSANRFGRVSPTTAISAKLELDDFLEEGDIILDGQASSIGIESTIIDCQGEYPRILRPGGVTREMIEETSSFPAEGQISGIRAPGLLETHYAPAARVFVGEQFRKGAGLIAPAEIQTPDGMVRLAAPISSEEYARDLYRALRDGDTRDLKEIVIVEPEGGGIAAAIRDRIERARTKKTG